MKRLERVGDQQVFTPVRKLAFGTDWYISKSKRNRKKVNNYFDLALQTPVQKNIVENNDPGSNLHP